MGGRYIPAAPDCIKVRAAGIKVDRVIIHTMQGTLDGSIAWFQKAGRPLPTAAHYLIGLQGEIVQMVPDDRRCIHAGSNLIKGYNDRSIGIEHPGFVDDGIPPTEATLLSSAKVAAIMCKKFSIPIDRTHIIGHSEVPHDPNKPHHTDPGEEWPWDRYMVMVHEAYSLLE